MAAETTLAGYTLLDRLAVGGMAEVYKARVPADEARSADEPEFVVLKRLHPEYRANEAFVSQFLDEGKLCVKLAHANIVRTSKVFKKGTDYFMVQEFVDGVTLARIFETTRGRGKAMDLSAAVYAVQQTLKALEYVHQAHRGEASSTIVHRDVNPANVLCGRNGAVKLTDFGVAETEGVSAVGSTGAIKGTLSYLSPEAVLGRPVDRRSDLFSTGIVLWEAVANRQLFPGSSDLEVMHKIRDGRVPLLSRVSREVPELLALIARKALFADPSLRFQAASEFHKALSVLATREGLSRGERELATEVQATLAARAPPHEHKDA